MYRVLYNKHAVAFVFVITHSWLMALKATIMLIVLLIGYHIQMWQTTFPINTYIWIHTVHIYFAPKSSFLIKINSSNPNSKKLEMKNFYVAERNHFIFFLTLAIQMACYFFSFNNGILIFVSRCYTTNVACCAKLISDKSMSDNIWYENLG